MVGVAGESREREETPKKKNQKETFTKATLVTSCIDVGLDSKEERGEADHKFAFLYTH